MCLTVKAIGRRSDTYSFALERRFGNSACGEFPDMIILGLGKVNETWTRNSCEVKAGPARKHRCSFNQEVLVAYDSPSTAFKNSACDIAILT